MISDLERMQKALNSKELSPKKGYRRDVAIYELVCYVNNITGCYLSGNLEPIRVFLSRARIYISENREDSINGGYFDLVERYLKLMEEYLNKEE